MGTSFFNMEIKFKIKRFNELSTPELYSLLQLRSEVFVVEQNCVYQDIDGKSHTITCSGLQAICIQHENDHLDGKVFVDYLSGLKQNFIKKKMKKLFRKLN